MAEADTVVEHSSAVQRITPEHNWSDMALNSRTAATLRASPTERQWYRPVTDHDWSNSFSDLEASLPLRGLPGWGLSDRPPPRRPCS